MVGHLLDTSAAHTLVYGLVATRCMGWQRHFELSKTITIK